MKTITITFGEQSENHVGMKIFGDGLAEEGYNFCDLVIAKDIFEVHGCECELVDLKAFLDEEERRVAEDCWILIIRKGVDRILEVYEKN